ncbi:hypothetical protein [Actinoplanes sp. NPDC051411]|uniref:DUF6197 family protein n=1 Tax=Actinoplanes sp. NPDC051411 TaxID=3155522 RepID=UPI0034433EAE
MSTVTALPSDRTVAILDQAADYITRHGWIPTSLYQAHRNCPLKCRVHRTGGYPASMLGAIRVAVFGMPRWYLDTADSEALHTYTAAVEWLNTYLLAVGHARQHACLFDWETAPERTRADVIAALQYAADACRTRASRRAA